MEVVPSIAMSQRDMRSLIRAIQHFMHELASQRRLTGQEVAVE